MIYMIEDNTGFPSPAGLGASKPAHFNYRKKMVLQKLISLSDTLSITVAVIPEKASDDEAAGVRKELKNNKRCVEEGVAFLSALKEQCNHTMRLLLNP